VSNLLIQVVSRGTLFRIVRSRKWREQFYFFGGFLCSINSSPFCLLFQHTSYVYLMVGSVAFPSVGALCVFVSMCISSSSLMTVAVKSYVVLVGLLPHFNHLLSGRRSCDIPFLLGHAVLQQLNFFFIRQLYKSGSDISWCFDPWRRDHYFGLKCWELITRWRSITSQKSKDLSYITAKA
jgi:hypothetical protein